MQVSITMRDARQKNYVLPNLLADEDARKRGSNTLKYIESLAGQTKTDINDWVVSKIFWNGNTSKLHDDRSKINKLFFAYRSMTMASATVTENKLRLSTDVYSEVVLLMVGNNKQRMDTIRNDVRNFLRYNDDYRRKISDNDDRLVEKGHELLALETLGDKVSTVKPCELEGLEKIVSEGFFEFVKFEDRRLHFITPEIVLKYRCVKGKIEKTAYMGRYHVYYNCRNMAVRIKAGAFNGKPNGHFHPHAYGSDGEVCWGSINTSHFKTNRDSYGLMRALQHVLTEYNDGSPYTKIDHYSTVTERFVSQWWIDNIDDKLPRRYPTVINPYEYKKALVRAEEIRAEILAANPQAECQNCGERLDDCSECECDNCGANRANCSCDEFETDVYEPDTAGAF